MADEVLAEVSVQQPSGPREVLRHQRLIQAEALPHGGHVLRRRPEPQHRGDRIAGHQVDHQEHEDAHGEDHRDREQQPPDDRARARAHDGPPGARSPIRVDQVSEHGLGQPEVSLRDPRRRRTSTVDHGFGERGVVLHGALADLAAVRLGAEAQADLPADLPTQVRQVGVPGRHGHRGVHGLIGGTRGLPIVAGPHVAVEGFAGSRRHPRGSCAPRPFARSAVRSAAGSPGGLRGSTIPAGASGGSSRWLPAPYRPVRRHHRCGRVAPRRSPARTTAGSPPGSSCG